MTTSVVALLGAAIIAAVAAIATAMGNSRVISKTMEVWLVNQKSKTVYGLQCSSVLVLSKLFLSLLSLLHSCF